MEEQPNVETQGFYDMLTASQLSLWDGFINHSELLASMRLLNIKTMWKCLNNVIMHFSN